ncbi:hypothetical protein Ancab_021003 [Ancistrocladus abbreviatus]
MSAAQRKLPWTPSPRHVSSATAKHHHLPRCGSLTENVEVAAVSDSGNVEDWRRFGEAGLLDEAALERRDWEALIEKVSSVGKEPFDSQYNMGLLLVDKNNLSLKCEELRQCVAEA